MNIIKKARYMQINADNLQANSLIKYARKEYFKENQKDFAKRMGSKQSLISKYESGFISPPSTLLIQCMNIYMESKNVSDNKADVEITTNTLINLVQSLLDGQEKANTRQIIAKLIRILSTS